MLKIPNSGYQVIWNIVNRLPGTKAQYLEALPLRADERELWRDTEADFAIVPRQGRAVVMSARA